MRSWFHIADALGRGPPNSTWDQKGACDGTVSFPDLGTKPMDGSTPIIMYGPDCGVPIPDDKDGLQAPRTGDAPRVEIALPAAVDTDPFLTNVSPHSWVLSAPSPWVLAAHPS